MVLVYSCLHWISCSVNKEFASFSSLFSARRWQHWGQSSSGCLLGHLLAVSIVGCDLGLFMPTVGWLGVPVLVNGITEIMVVASATSMLSPKSMPLSSRTDKWKKDIYFSINILDDVLLLTKLGQLFCLWPWLWIAFALGEQLQGIFHFQNSEMEDILVHQWKGGCRTGGQTAAFCSHKKSYTFHEDMSTRFLNAINNEFKLNSKS